MFRKLSPKSEFSRNVLTLMTGTTIAQAIPIAISPIITRLYSPDDFAIFAIYMGLASMLTVAATGRYELAIMLPKHDKDAINIVILSIIIASFISLFSFIIFFIFNTDIANFLGNKDVANWLYFIPATVFVSGLYQSFNYWNNRKKHYKKLANGKMLQSSTTAVTNITMGVSHLNTAGLILGSLVGQIISTWYIGKTAFIDKKEILKYVNKLKIIALSKKYIKFPTWNLFASFIHISRQNIIIIFLAKYFLSSTLGFYYFAEKLLRAPSNVLISAFSDVYYQRLSKVVSHEEMYALSIAYVKKMIMILTIPYLILLLSLKTLVPIIFGETWNEVYIYLYILSAPIFFNVVTAHFSKIFIIINKQEVSFYLHLSKLIGLLIVIFFLYIYHIFSIDALIILAINEILWILLGVLIIKRVLNIEKSAYMLYSLFIVLILIEIFIYVQEVR